ncbi:MAG: zinc-ribbon domain-containing protein [Peptoniphilaceae bacterium]
MKNNSSKPSLENFLLAILMIIIGVFWAYFSYIATSNIRQSDQKLIGFILPLVGIIFILMGIFQLQLLIKKLKTKREISKFHKEENLNDHDDFETNKFANSRIIKNKDKLDGEDYIFKKNFKNLYKESSLLNKSRSDLFEEKIINKEDTNLDKKRIKYCPYCGEYLKENYKYCPECGEKIR